MSTSIWNSEKRKSRQSAFRPLFYLSTGKQEKFACRQILSWSLFSCATLKSFSFVLSCFHLFIFCWKLLLLLFRTLERVLCRVAVRYLHYTSIYCSHRRLIVTRCMCLNQRLFGMRLLYTLSHIVYHKLEWCVSSRCLSSSDNISIPPANVKSNESHYAKMLYPAMRGQWIWNTALKRKASASANNNKVSRECNEGKRWQGMSEKRRIKSNYYSCVFIFSLFFPFFYIAFM